MFTEQWALAQAISAAQQSPCAKTQRGAVLWRRASEGKQGLYLGAGFNHPPKPFKCDGSVACRENCNKVCNHAEEDALLKVPTRVAARWSLPECEMLHIEVVNGRAVSSGQPTCWQCSRKILAVGLKAMWLFHKSGLKSYTPEEFHRLTLKNNQLPILEGS